MGWWGDVMVQRPLRAEHQTSGAVGVGWGMGSGIKHQDPHPAQPADRTCTPWSAPPPA